MKYLFALFILFSQAVNAEPRELFWEDLVPSDYIVEQGIINHDGSMIQVGVDAPVVNELDGLEVKIPGFVVPLEGDANLTREFLLVPYFGACIHVPPPPANQIVYVKFSDGVPIENLNDAVWVVGTLSTKGWSGEIATVGYSLTGMRVEPFEG